MNRRERLAGAGRQSLCSNPVIANILSRAAGEGAHMSRSVRRPRVRARRP
jgi:hypothetical protein